MKFSPEQKLLAAFCEQIKERMETIRAGLVQR